MTPDNKVLLGTFEFREMEIPEEIAVGRKQRLVIHDLVGGGRVIDAMGTNLQPLEWTGLMQGQDAFDRAKQLKAMIDAGKTVVLDVGRLGCKVVIESFTYRYQRFYHIPYSIVCMPLPGAVPAAAASVNQSIKGDLSTCSALGQQIGDAGITGSLSSLSSAISSVSDFAKATSSQIQGVLQPLNDLRGQVTTLIASAANTANNIATVGGLFPNNPAAQAIGKVMNQVNVYNKLPVLYQLQAVSGRMANNIGTASTAGSQMATAGGDLMKIAAEKYGDAMAWTGIAKANKLTDPKLSGVKTIIVPPQPDDSGGVIKP